MLQILFLQLRLKELGEKLDEEDEDEDGDEGEEDDDEVVAINGDSEDNILSKEEEINESNEQQLEKLPRSQSPKGRIRIKY